ncbi:hypothetical protein EJB05_24339, partial [Eragrostis curvula]
EICHDDLKIENTLLDGSPAPRVNIVKGFGYSKKLFVDSVLAVLLSSTIGTLAYMAPKVLLRKEYDGK